MTEVRLKLGDPVVITRMPVGGYYGSEDGTENPREIFGVGTWKKISPANTVAEVKNLSGDDDFIITGTGESGTGIYVWKRLS